MRKQPQIAHDPPPTPSMALAPFVADDNNFKLIQYHEDRMRILEEENDADKFNSYVLYTASTIEEFMKDPPRHRKRQLIVEYCAIIGISTPLNHIEQEPEGLICKSCSGYMYECQKDALMVCTDCGYSEPYQDLMSAKSASYEHVKHVIFKTQYTYERTGHLREEIEQCQGIESRVIPQPVLDTVLVQCRKEKRTTMRGFKKQDMRAILKRAELPNYYKNSIKIIQLLGGDTGLDLRTHEKLIYVMFKKIDGTLFDEFKYLLNKCRLKSQRQNFLNFKYTLRKFLELLDFPADKLNDIFPYLKDELTLKVYDEVWKNFCIRLGWKFIASFSRD